MSRATGPKYNVPFRRRRDCLTNYAKREKLLRSDIPRLVVRKTNRNIVVHIVKYAPEGDQTVALANSKELSKFGWPARANTPTAYLVGMLAAQKAAKTGVKKVILDTGLTTPSKGSLMFAALRGAIDGGLESKMDENLVDMKRITGEHLAAYAASGKQFGGYAKQGVDVSKIPQLFEKAKQSIKA